MKIIVGNLPHKVSTEDLVSLFRDYGDITSASIIMDKFTGKSRGYGFVEMPNRDEALAAIKDLNEKTIAGKRIRVQAELPHREGKRFGGGGTNDTGPRRQRR